MRELGRGLQRFVGDGDAVVRLVLVAQAAQDLNGELDGWFRNLDRLEAALEGGVLFDVFAVLVERGCADRLEFTAREHRLEDACRVDRAFGGTCTDEGVDFVDKEDDVAAGTDLLQDLLEALFEVTAIAGASHEGAQVERVEVLVLEGLRHVATHDRLREPFNDGGLTDAWFTDENRVVLGAARQDLHDAFHLVFAPDDGVEFVLACCGGQVAAELVEDCGTGWGSFLLVAGAATCSGWFLGGVVAGDELDDFLADSLWVCAEAVENLRGGTFAFADQAEQDVLGTDVVVAQLEGFTQRKFEDFLGAWGERDMTCWGLGALANDFLDLLTYRSERYVEGF